MADLSVDSVCLDVETIYLGGKVAVFSPFSFFPHFFFLRNIVEGFAPLFQLMVCNNASLLRVS